MTDEKVGVGASSPSSSSSALTNFLEQFQKIFSCCCGGDEVLETEDQDDSTSNGIIEEKESPWSPRPSDSSQFYALYPNFASFVVEPQDFRGKVMAPFDLPPDVSHDDKLETIKTKRYSQGDDWDKYRNMQEAES